VYVRYVTTWVSVTVMSAMHLRIVTGRAVVAVSTVDQSLFYTVSLHS